MNVFTFPIIRKIYYYIDTTDVNNNDYRQNRVRV